MEFRRIDCRDVDALTKYAIAAIPDDPGLRISPDKVRSLVVKITTHPYDFFQLAAFDGGQVVGGIAACAQEMPFHERCEAMVVFCFASMPGVGRKLIAELIKWAKTDMRVRRIVWPMNAGYDPCIWHFAKRAGFQERQDMFLWSKFVPEKE